MWLNSERQRQSFVVERISLTDSTSWAISNGVLSHRTGRFFSIRGVEWHTPDGSSFQAPFIDQPEIGKLALAACRARQTHILLCAKFEPGNLRGIELAPSLQATKSNLDQVHGGSRPELSDFFQVDPGELSLEVEHSEQGTRFLNKFNLNIVRESEVLFPPPEATAWFTFDQLRPYLKQSHTCNTDLRSVLVSMDWGFWVPDTNVPFDESYWNEISLRESFEATGNQILSRVLTQLSKSSVFSQNDPTYRELIGKGEQILVDSNARLTGSEIVHVLSSSNSRETKVWDQPLLTTPKLGEEVLCGAKVDGVLKFCFFTQSEVGFPHRIELGNTAASEDPARHGRGVSDGLAAALRRAGTSVGSIVQSDEGGRFFNQQVRYEIRILGTKSELALVPIGGVWLSLGEINQLSSVSKIFTNEARTSISIILAAL
jgi:oxidase EvaA